MSENLLTIGMATRGEPDHVWFVLQALHANHPRVDYLVVDNTPERDSRVEAVARAVGGRYRHRPDLTGTSRPRDAVFRFAETPWVMCIDSHVILETGAVRAALDYCAAHPNSRDLVQGPLVGDDGRWVSTHWGQTHAPGLWGTWQTDPRGVDPAAPPFEIPMMGLGLWMMRRDAWPGFHPANRGFGGEEGYIHELVRQRGGRALCLPALRWRHKFRDVSGWHKNPPPPYPLRLEDHAWNLLVGHRELGIDADAQIFDQFGKRLPPATWTQLVEDANRTQPAGGPRPEVRRQRILALWYSDNSAPAALLERSARSVIAAQGHTLRHDVFVSADSWAPVPGDPFGGPQVKTVWEQFDGPKIRSHGTIVAQIRQAANKAQSWWWSAKTSADLSRPPQWTLGEFDAVCFLEHDVLYPPDYFDRVGDALANHPDAPIASNLDYIGLNGTGWQNVREQHEPLHQLTLRWDTFVANLERAAEQSKGGAQVNLEPYADAAWKKRVQIVRGAPEIQMPAVHVNHSAGRFTSHGDVCYEPRGYSLNHPHWGEARHWWPGEMTPAAGGCGSCAAPSPPPPDTLSGAYEAARSKPSDFHEHVATLRDLAAGCASAVELSLWYKVADVALAAGLGATGRLTAVCPGPKPQWGQLARWMGDRFTGVAADPGQLPAVPELPDADLWFIDTAHTADALMPLLERFWTQANKYIVVHCTETFGEHGDADGRPGVMHALRTFCQLHPEWAVLRRDRNNHGLIVLSRREEDRKQLPSLWRKAMNFATAKARHVAAGLPVVTPNVLEARQAECAVCEYRALDACSACGCPLEAKLLLSTERCGLVKLGLAPKWEAVA